MDFDLHILLRWIVEIDPEVIYIGYDNYNSKLPEPSLKKTELLATTLIDSGYDVRLKTLRYAWWEKPGT